MVNILDFIPYGHDNAVTREYLCAVTGMPDRKVRKHIEEAIKEGAMIANVGKGYFQLKDSTDIPYFEAYYRSNDNKGWSIINQNRPKKKKLEAYKRMGAPDCPTERPYHQMSILDVLGGINETG